MILSMTLISPPAGHYNTGNAYLVSGREHYLIEHIVKDGGGRECEREASSEHQDHATQRGGGGRAGLHCEGGKTMWTVQWALIVSRSPVLAHPMPMPYT